MVNLRKRPSAPVSSRKRTTSRASAASNEEKFIEVVSEESDGEDLDISIDSNDDNEDIEDSEESDITLDEELDNDNLSEDDKEIQRIIEKSQEETRNIPLTARQRAKLTNEDEEVTEETEQVMLTDEQTLKNSEKSRRRKLQRDAKVEETKRATIDRLLQKQQKKTPSKEEVEASEALQKATDKELKEAQQILSHGTVRFINREKESLVEFPDMETFAQYTQEFLLPANKIKSTATCEVCSKNTAKYTHPSTGKAFCSISCYKVIIN